MVTTGKTGVHTRGPGRITSSPGADSRLSNPGAFLISNPGGHDRFDGVGNQDAAPDFLAEQRVRTAATGAGSTVLRQVLAAVSTAAVRLANVEISVLRRWSSKENTLAVRHGFGKLSSVPIPGLRLFDAMMEESMRLAGRVALITGGAQGIGRATAVRFAREGADVAIVDRDETRGERTREQLHGGQNRCLFFRRDVSDFEEINGIVDRTLVELGRIDILVNNAATYLYEESGDLDDWQKLLDVNLTAYWAFASAAAETMKGQIEGGAIVNVCSVHHLISDSISTAYAVSKAGVYQLTRSLAMTLAPHGIQVNSVSPGFIRTAMAVVNGVDETTTTEFEQGYLKNRRIPLGRVGFPDEIASAILYLASRECRYITGADIVVDGGLTLTL